MVAFVAAQWSGAGVGGKGERERERALRGGVEGKKEKKKTKRRVADKPGGVCE